MIKRKSQRKSRNQRRNKRRRAKSQSLDYGTLEAKQLLAADLSISSIQLIDGNGQEITSPAIGEQIQVEINYETTDLPANAEYKIQAEYNGFALESGILTTGAGVASASGTEVFEGWYTGSVFLVDDLNATIDFENNVAESDENNNLRHIDIDPNQVNSSVVANAPINDGQTTISTIDVFDAGIIEDLNIGLNINHTFTADLDVFLTSPEGTTVELFTDVGGGGVNFTETLLDDQATNDIASGSAPFTGSFSPEGMLSDFDGESITGTWTLEVTDDFNGDTGQLLNWSILAETSSDFITPLSWPVGAEAFTEIGVGGYVDVDPTSSRDDFNGREAALHGGEEMLINIHGVSTMDQGVEILAAAAGTISDVHDGENDRHNGPNTGPANFVVIDHGDGWQTTYTHLRRDSIQVNVGDIVSQGQTIAMMGSGTEYFGTTGLNFKLTHRGRPVESMIAPDVYQSSGEFQYVYDAAPAVYSASVSNQDVTIAFEGQSSSSIFKLGDEVSYAFSYGGVESSEERIAEIIDPSGNVFATNSFSPFFPISHGTLASVPDQIGTWKAQIKVNGVLLNSTEFEVTAEGAPEIRIDHGTGSTTHVRDGRHTPIDFGTTSFSQGDVEKTFTVTNHGGQPLEISGLVAPAGFLVVEGLSSTLAPGASDDFTIKLDANFSGTKFGQVFVMSNDADEAIYNFPVEGMVDSPDHERVDFGLSRINAAETSTLMANLRRTGDLSAAATFDLTVLVGDASDITIPAQVTIPAGQSTVRFPIVAASDFDFDGDKQYGLIASDSAHGDAYEWALAELTIENIDDRFETGGDSNNTLATATDLGMLAPLSPISEPGLNIANGVDSNGDPVADDDYFKVTPATDGQLVVDLTFAHANGDLDLFLYDSSGSLVYLSGSQDDNEQVRYEVIGGEEYFVRVLGSLETENTYDLDIRLNTQVGESGTVTTTDGDWFRVDFANSYNNPVVVAGPLSNNGADPATVRVRNVDSTGFDARVLEWDYLNQIHGAEEFSYMVIESGEHTLPDGSILRAGNQSSVNHNWATIDFGGSFDETPIVLTQTVSSNGASAVVTRHQNIGTDSFEVFLQEEQGGNQIHANETVAWIAIEPGAGDGYEAGIAPAVTHDNFTIDFDNSYGTPTFIATIQSFNGADPSGLRRAGLNGDDATVFLQEETSADSETDHIAEVVGFLAFDQGNIFAQVEASLYDQLGESGTLNLTHEWTTVNLDQTYIDPVVIMGAGANAGSDPYTFRVRNVTGNSFEVQVDEWDYLNGLHNAVETVSYMVVEAGEHELADGTKFVAANVPVDHNLSTFDLSPYGFSGPIVLSQTVTVNGASAVTTRHSNVTPTEFSIQLQEEEAGNQIHSVETVSLFIIESGTGDSDGQLYEGGFVDLTHNEANFGFFNSYSSTPLLFSQMQSKVGSDPGVIRHTTLDASGFGVYIDEEQSADSETNHNAVENTGVFAMEEGDIFGNSFAARGNTGLQLISSEPGKDDLNGSLGNFVKTPATNPGDNDVAFSKDDWFASLSDLDQKTLAGAVEGSVVRVPHEAMVGLDELFESKADDEKTDSVLEFDLI